MNWKNTAAGYGAPARALHWISLLLIVVVYATMEFRSIFPRGSAERALMMATHFSLGMTLFVLVWLRVAAHFSGPAPQIVPPIPRWQHAASKAVQGLLYLMLIALPLLGWACLNAKGRAVPFFGLELPIILAPDDALGKRLEEIHVVIAKVGYALIGLHAAAALFHHYVQKDNTLRMMLGRR